MSIDAKGNMFFDSYTYSYKMSNGDTISECVHPKSLADALKLPDETENWLIFHNFQ